LVFLPGNAAANTGRGGKLNSHLMASCVKIFVRKTKSDFSAVFAKIKFYKPRFVTAYCELMKSNKSDIKEQHTRFY